MPAIRDTYRSIPALAQYIDRHGAKEKNFRRWLVQEDFGHYYKEKCVIKLAPDGTITVSDPAYAPTEAEAAAIKLHFAEGGTFPHSVEARYADVEDDLLPMLRAEHQLQAVDENGDPKFFTFYNQRTGLVKMVQQRIDTPQGKRYIPWCKWSDGLWRAMEPDGDLPFWKPKQPIMTATGIPMPKIMVHEGAKAAQFVQAICDDPLSTHPWAEELREYEHWGMIGGALSPHRADYQELLDRELELLVYVCDNDWPGRSALPVVSKKYKRTIRGVYFDSSFPPHWDMADPMPATFFTSAGRYIGKPLRDLMRLCTWATELVPAPGGGKGRPTIVINPYFLKEWAHVRKPEVYVNVGAALHVMTEREFNSWVNPFSDTDETARVLRRKDAHKAVGLDYNPARPSGMVKAGEDFNYINTHVPKIIKPEQGDCAPWEEYINHLITDAGDRNAVIRWCATLVCHPEIKMSYGMLLISETQGVGKSTLGSHILKPILGEWNCSEPSEKTVVESRFNGWCARKRLAIIHEIYAGNNSLAYDQLKSVITEATLTVDEKYQAAYTIDNWLHVIACSNSKRALKLSMDDRRWLVPSINEQKRHREEWNRLRNWLDYDGGLNKLKWWFADWLPRNGGPVMPNEDAPNSNAKRDVVRDGYGPGGAMLKTFLDRLSEEHNGEPVAFADLDVQRMIRDHVYEGRPNDKIERAATLRKIAKGEGWFVSNQPVQALTWATNRGARAYVITNDAGVAELPTSELLERFPRPLDVATKAREYFGVM